MSEPLDILQQYWGYPGFRPLQEEIIRSVLEGDDTLALLPTGGGKSICFQVPALCREGICVVVSPLIALMKDQVYHLQRRGIAAEAVYSGMERKDIDRILDNCVYGKVKFLYLSPERLTTELARERIKRMPVNLLAVDEAHCISQWGYDFRPPYLLIDEIREFLPDVPVLALTATATSEVVVDIQEQLGFRQQRVFQKSFARDNLAYVVLQEEAKVNKLVEILQKVPGSSVVYVRSRRKTREIADTLKRHRISAGYYHAGLHPDQRSQRQEDWIQNRIRVMVSTNAFGMGIDKPDVRTVVHLDLPDSLEAYFQEAGRAGRDGKKAYAVLLYNPSDARNLEWQFEISYPSIEEIRRVYQALGSYFQLAVGGGQGSSFDFDISDFTQRFRLEMLPTYSALRLLEKEGWISLTEAVYIPSRLQIIVDKEQLYDYQLRNRQADAILKTILRTYQGAFTHPVKIREGQLAYFLKIAPNQLKQQLNQMEQAGIIRYFPQKDKPQLTFLEARVDGPNLDLDWKRYHFLKNRQLERIRKSVGYAETVRCRSRQLLEYFGEKSAKDCGQCDVCLGRTRVDLSEADFSAYKVKVRQLLSEQPLELETVVTSFSPKRRAKVIQVIDYLVDEGELKLEEGVLSLPTQ